MNNYDGVKLVKGFGGEKVTKEIPKITNTKSESTVKTPLQKNPVPQPTPPTNALKRQNTASSKTDDGSEKPFQCKHLHLIPLEFSFGKYKQNSNFDRSICDWSANIMGASRCRVDVFYCPECKEKIKSPEPNLFKETP